MSFRRSDGLLARLAGSAMASVLLAGPVGAAPPSARPAAEADDAKFKLKPGAHGKVCLGCHSDFEDKLKLPAIHTPVKAGACVDCHSPHASDHGKMLAKPPEAICVSCHATIVPAEAKSVHAALRKGGCVACHDPHASPNKNQLLKPVGELCVGCHQDIGAQIAKVKFHHPPVITGCVTCHDPHASAKSETLLVRDQGSLCASCHKPDQPAMTKAHMGYPVSKGRCTSCHDPHGSDAQAMLWPSVHKPVATRSCGQCHNDPGSANALKTKRQGIDVCRGCHGEVVGDAMNAKRLHWPVADKIACLNCHGPHATKAPKLVRGPLTSVCGNCHADTIRRQERSETKHPPVESGDCTSCHAPHGSDNPFLLAAPDELQLCGTCHDWQNHTGHPIGPKAVDPRNKNLTVSCESCHRAHGTEFKHFAHLDTKGDLCVQCHERFRR